MPEFADMKNDWFENHRLFHYTTAPEVVKSILEVGFLLIPNKRHLIHRFLPDDDFSRREPQEFGMTCFTELRLGDSRTHREQFGDFAIGVSWEWALRNGAQRVIYVGEERGAVFETLKWLFRLGRQEVERIRGGEDGMVLENKALAGGLGAEVYHAMLTLYEYMERERNSSQVEWRIVEKTPFYHTAATREGLVKEVLATAHTWNACRVPIQPRDVEMFVCPSMHMKSLKAALPEQFKEVPIHPQSSRASVSSWFAAAAASFRALLRRRERIIHVPYEPPKGSILLPKASDGTAVLLPWVTKLGGVALHPTAIKSDVWFDFQYQDQHGEILELRMAVPEARKLLGFLLEMEHIGWRAPYQ